MPITDYDELSLEGVNIDQTVRRFSVLKASFGDGYESGALVGAANGLHRWTLSSGAWPDSATYGQINGKTWMEYYWSFFQSHVSAGNTPFLIEWRGRKYFASFDNVEQTVEVFTSNLFAGNLTITQRRIAGYYEGTDGSVFDPTFVEDYFWAWYDQDSFNYFGGTVTDKTANGNNLGINNDVDNGPTQNGIVTQTFNGTTGSGYLNTSADPVIYEAFFALKFNEATFATYRGILTADATTAALVGNTGDTKLVNFSFGSSYRYWKNGTELTEATQNAPMNTFGVIHARFGNGITLTNLQIGKDRADVSRYMLANVGEIILCDTVLTDEIGADMDGWLKYKWGVA